MQPNVNVPNQAPMHQAQPMQQPMQHSQAPKTSKLPWIILTVVIVIVLGVLGYVFRSKLGFQKQTDLSGYSAVFLTNGQVYFGKLTHANDNYVELTDIFYLQVNQTQASGANGSAATPAAGQTAAANQAAPQLSLVKLGNELHGPSDQMWISRSQVLFYENLKSDGKVAEAIQQYKANPNAANGTASGTPNQTGNPQQAAPASGTSGNINTAPAGTAPAAGK